MAILVIIVAPPRSPAITPAGPKSNQAPAPSMAHLRQYLPQATDRAFAA
jgi:hypothetical protein